jgi:hypothetical protein
MSRWVTVFAVAAIIILAASTGLLANEYLQQQNTIGTQSAQISTQSAQISTQSAQISKLTSQVDNQSEVISNLSQRIQSLTSMLNRHGTELLTDVSNMTVGPAIPSTYTTTSLGIVWTYIYTFKSFGNFSFPYDGYVVVSVSNSSLSVNGHFYIYADWKGAGGETLITPSFWPNPYICGGVPLQCPLPDGGHYVPGMLVIPVISGSTLSLTVQNPEPNTLWVSLSVEYYY